MPERIPRWIQTPDWRRQYGLRRAVWNTLGRMGLTGVHSAPVHRGWLDIRRVPMPLKHLDPAFAGFRIAQVSDLHFSPVVWRGFLAEQLRHVADLRPDMLVVTGDLITGGYRYARTVAKVLAGLDPRPPEGIVCILGNHDYSVHGKSQSPEGQRRADHLTSELRREGIVMLRNETLRVERPGATTPLTIVGLDDLWSGHLDARAGFEGVRHDDPVICLNHDPKNARQLLEFPWQWMLAGHTHGRQLATSPVGKRLNKKRVREFVRGYYPLAPDKHLYVNRGLSYGQRTQRWCRPEITLFRLSPISDEGNVAEAVTQG